MESLLAKHLEAAPKGLKAGYSLAKGVGRDHPTLSSAVAELKAKSGILEATLDEMLRGPGGVGPIDWCHHHGITNPLANFHVRLHYYQHFGIGITSPEGSVHYGSIYWRSYGMYSDQQVEEYIAGKEITPAEIPLHPRAETASTRVTSREMQTIDPSMVSTLTQTETPSEAILSSEPSPVRYSEHDATLMAEEETLAELEDYSDWLDPEQANGLREELKIALKEKDQMRESLKLSQGLVSSLRKEKESLREANSDLQGSISKLEEVVREKTDNEKYTQAQLEKAATTAKAEARGHYSPLLAHIRSLAVMAGIPVEGVLTTGKASQADAMPLQPPPPSDWQTKPTDNLSLENFEDWRKWVALVPPNQLNNQTMSSLLNTGLFKAALQRYQIHELTGRCGACGEDLSVDKVARSARSHKPCKSHLDGDNLPTGVAAGECHAATHGTCGTCVHNGVLDTKHAQSQCPLKPGLIKAVMASQHLKGAVKHLGKAVSGGSSRSSSKSSKPEPEVTQPHPESHSETVLQGCKRSRDESGSDSVTNPKRAKGRGGKGKGGGRIAKKPPRKA